MAYAYKTLGQNVQAKAPYEFRIAHGKGRPCAPFSIILGGKTDPAIGKGGNAVIADRDLMGIAPQVFHNIFWTCKWAFGIHHPIFGKEFVIECPGLVKLLSEVFYEPCPEDLAHLLYGKKILPIVLGMFTFSVGGNTPSRNDTM